MGRLTSMLLNERTTASYTPVDGKHFKKYGDYVNILRMILLGQSGTYNSMPTGPKAAAIFGETAMAKEMAEAYKKLRAKLKDPKAKVGDLKVVKKAYFSLLFGEILRAANIPAFRATTLASTFSGGKHGDFNDKQQEIIYKIAKALLVNKAELEGQDVKELNLIISGFEEDMGEQFEQEHDVDSAEDNDLAKKVSLMDDVTITETETSITSKIDAATVDSKLKQTEAQVLAQELNYQGLNVGEFTDAKMIKKIKDPTLEPMAIDMKNIFVKDIDMIKSPYGAAKDEFLKKTLTTFVSDSLSHMMNHLPKDLLEQMTPTMIIRYDEGTNSIWFEMEDDIRDLKLVRTFKLDNNGDIESVKHDLFELPPAAQDSGLAKAMIADNLKLYKASGVKKVTLHANIGMGGYVWLRYGFRPDADQLVRISESFVDISNSVKYGLKKGYTVGITPDMAFQSLIQHFKNPALTEYLTEVKATYDEFYANLQSVWDDFGYDPNGYGETAPVTANMQFNDVVGEIFKSIGEQMKAKFNVNPDTLYADISLTKIEVTAKAPTIKLEIDSRQPARAKQMIKSKLPKTSFPMGGTAKLTMSVKNLLTLTGATADNTNGDHITVFPGNPADWSSGRGEMPGALNWKGSLDLTDDTQYQVAMDYATAKKS